MVNASGNNANINVGSGTSSITTTGNNNTFTLNQGNANINASGSENQIRFGSGILKDTVAFYMDGNDLKIGYTGDSSSLFTVKGDGNSNPSVTSFTLNDGEYLSNADVNLLIQQMSAYAANHQGVEFTSLNDVKNSPDLMNMVNSSWHHA